MRKTMLLLAAGAPGQAMAHELPGREGLLHEILSLHHLPAVLLLAIGLALLIRSLRRGRRAANRSMHP